MNKSQNASREIDALAASILETHNAQASACYAKYTGLQTFKPQQSDVFIVSWMKSGTTLMQQLIYQLLAATGRVPGDPEGERFNDISEVVPFIEPCHSTGITESINPYEPRVWKSHATFDSFKGEDFRKCKFIYCVRDGLRVAPSFLDFTIDWIVGSPVTDEIISFVAQKCSREAMTKDNRFNDTTISKMMGWDVNGGVRVREKDSPSFKNVALPERYLELYNDMFQEAFGMKDYCELVENLRERNNF